MQFILAAILVVVGAGPLCDWLMLSPYAQFIWDFQQSVAIKSLLVHPDWLLTGGFMMACYGIAGVLLDIRCILSAPKPYVRTDVAPAYIKQASARKTTSHGIVRNPE